VTRSEFNLVRRHTGDLMGGRRKVRRRRTPKPSASHGRPVESSCDGRLSLSSASAWGSRSWLRPARRDLARGVDRVHDGARPRRAPRPWGGVRRRVGLPECPLERQAVEFGAAPTGESAIWRQGARRVRVRFRNHRPEAEAQLCKGSSDRYGRWTTRSSCHGRPSPEQPR